MRLGFFWNLKKNKLKLKVLQLAKHVETSMFNALSTR